MNIEQMRLKESAVSQANRRFASSLAKDKKLQGVVDSLIKSLNPCSM